MLYIEELRVRVVDCFGNMVATKSDAKKLRDVIFSKQKEYLSESTIRRFFKLIPFGSASRTTLDVFSRFVGFDNYSHFTDYCEQLIADVAKNNTDQAVLSALQSKNSLSIFEINLINNRIIQLINEEDYKGLSTYFNHDVFAELIRSNKSLNDLFAQTLGPHFANQFPVNEIEKILTTTYFIPLILNHFVDIQNSGMLKFYMWILDNVSEKSELVFPASVIALNHVMNNQLEEAKSYFMLIDENEIGSSPPLNGRIALLKFIFSNDFDELLITAQKFAEQIHLFCVDIVPYLIYTKNNQLLKRWFSQFPHASNSNTSWVEKDILDMLLIGKLISENNFIEVKRIRKNYVNNMNSLSLMTAAYAVIDEI